MDSMVPITGQRDSLDHDSDPGRSPLGSQLLVEHGASPYVAQDPLWNNYWASPGLIGTNFDQSALHHTPSVNASPYIAHASPWSNYSASPSLMITTSQQVSPRYTPLRSVNASPYSNWSASPGMMITTSQYASPAVSVHMLEAAPNRLTPLSPPPTDPHARSSLGDRLRRRVFKPLPSLTVIDEYSFPPLGPVGSLQRSLEDNVINPDASSSALASRDEWVNGITWASLDPHTYSQHASNLPPNILQRIFDVYADSLKRDASRSPFANLETLLQVCKHWKNVAEHHESIWAKVYITLIDKRDVIKWIGRIKRYSVRARFLTDVSIQDRRLISSNGHRQLKNAMQLEL
ncbi:hypothetical protein PIIN_06823 [Serendipita indica DSM 11827]|uniref:F-box domain-containing protein n=1 Tax=Serendipita indica (strain DSM 11827) TaxID=1109443 RepID=G4TNJ9_SERID|nr:hypothetical protein PIIN_06823 [Serendipita indica DSM 11827]